MKCKTCGVAVWLRKDLIAKQTAEETVWAAESPWDGQAPQIRLAVSEDCPECGSAQYWTPGRTALKCAQCERVSLPLAVRDAQPPAAAPALPPRLQPGPVYRPPAAPSRQDAARVVQLRRAEQRARERQRSRMVVQQSASAQVAYPACEGDHKTLGLFSYRPKVQYRLWDTTIPAHIMDGCRDCVRRRAATLDVNVYEEQLWAGSNKSRSNVPAVLLIVGIAGALVYMASRPEDGQW